MIQKSHFGILFLKIIFRAYKFFIFVQTFHWTSSHFIFNFRFSSRKSQSQQNRSLILQYSFAQKTSLILRTSTHFTLKIICSRKNAKNLSHFTNFQANMFEADPQRLPVSEIMDCKKRGYLNA